MNAKEFRKLRIACERAHHMHEQHENDMEKIAKEQMAIQKEARKEIFPEEKNYYRFCYDYIIIDAELFINCKRWERGGYGDDEIVHSEPLSELMFSEEGRQQLKKKYLNKFKQEKARNEANAIKQREADLEKKKKQLEQLKQEIEEYKHGK